MALVWLKTMVVAMLVWVFGMLTGNTPLAVDRTMLDHGHEWVVSTLISFSGDDVQMIRVLVITGVLVSLVIYTARLRPHPPNFKHDVGDGVAYLLAGMIVAVLMIATRGVFPVDTKTWYVMLNEFLLALIVSHLVTHGRLWHEEWMARRPIRGTGAQIILPNSRVILSAHQPAGRGMCCVCDTENQITFQCSNIADRVCIACVVRWTTRNTQGNHWPCCRGS
jgi:hypothetical protein